MENLSVLLPELAALLERRLTVIADTALRDQDPALQLEQLKQASEAIDAWYREHRSALPQQLRHYLSQASLSKALDWCRENMA